MNIAKERAALLNPYWKQLADLRMLWNKSGKGRHLYGIERWALMFLSAFQMLMPTMLLRWLSGREGLHARKIAIDTYAVVKAALLLYILQSQSWHHEWAWMLAALFVIDLYAYLLGIVLLRGFWHPVFSYPRSLLLLGFNLVEFVSAFAIFYLASGTLVSNGGRVTDWAAALYFSVVTMATVGYGDIVPTPGLGRTLVIAQIFASLGLLAIVLTYFVTNIERERLPLGSRNSRAKPQGEKGVHKDENV